MKDKYIIIGRLIASFLLLSATYLATVSIPKIDEKIHKENTELERIKNVATTSSRSVLNIAIITTASRIAKLESNLIRYLNLGKDNQNIALLEMFNDYKVMANSWASLITDSTSSDNKYIVNNQIESIITNKNLSMEEKYKQISQIMTETRNAAINRFNENTKTAFYHTNNKEALKKIRVGRYSCFVWLQISGLIFLGLVEIIDKSITNRKLSKK